MVLQGLGEGKGEGEGDGEEEGTGEGEGEGEGNGGGGALPTACVPSGSMSPALYIWQVPTLSAVICTRT